MNKEDSNKSARVEGYDLARALAIIGMAFVNLRVILQLMGENVSGTGDWIANWLMGRASAIFVVLAGVGIALLTRNAANDRAELSKARWRLLWRALFLAVIGWPFLIIWEGDILHYYAAFFLIGSLAFHRSTRWLLYATGIIAMLAVPVLLVWERNWDFSTMSYKGLWTLNGQLMHLFLNGFHPLIPWLAFLLLGLALGRHLQRYPKARIKLLMGAIAIAVCVELISAGLVKLAIQNGMNASEIKPLLGTTSMPPLPQYVLAAGSCAVAVICGCLWLGAKLAGHRVLRPFIYLGQMALTLYIVHVFAFIFPLVVFTIENPGYWNLGKCIAITAAFCVVATTTTAAWRHFLPQGPAEWLMRRFSDFTDLKRWLALAGAGSMMGLLVTGTLILESSSSAVNFSLSSQSFPDAKEYEARCTRWITTRFFFKSEDSYDIWTKKHFGSKIAFEDEWLTKMYFEYSKQKPMNEANFHKWLSARVEAHIDTNETNTSTLNKPPPPSANSEAEHLKNQKPK